MGLEGCGEKVPLDPNSVFSLSKCQDFGARTSLNAMHLVGGASLYPYVAYFSRSILQNPGQVLPINSFCVGRCYRPKPDPVTTQDLTRVQQSSAVQVFSVSGTPEDMEQQLDLVINTMVGILAQVLPYLKVTEKALKDCETCDSRRFSITTQGAREVEIGHIAVQGNYFSRRLMMSARGKEEGEYCDLHTVSGQLSVTSLLAVMVELSQDKGGGVDLKSWWGKLEC